MDGRTVLNRDILYLPKVSVGSPFSQCKSYGFFAISLTHVVFIPTLMHRVEKTDALSSNFKVNQSVTKEYEGTPFFDVIPEKAKEHSPYEISEYLFQMAKVVPDSLVVDLASVENIKLSTFSLKIEAGEKSFTVGLGVLPKLRKIAERYLLENFSFPSLGVPTWHLNLGKKLAFLACLFLVLTVGALRASKAPTSDELVQLAFSEIDKSADVIYKASAIQRQATEIFEKRNDQRQIEDGYFHKFEEARDKGAGKDELKEIAQKIADSMVKEKELHFQGCVHTFLANSLVLHAELKTYEANKVLIKNLSDENEIEMIRKQQGKIFSDLVELERLVYDGKPECPGLFWKKPVKNKELSDAPKIRIEFNPSDVVQTNSPYHQVGDGSPAWYYRVDIRNVSKSDMTIHKLNILEKREGQWLPAAGIGGISHEQLKSLFIEEDLLVDLKISSNTSATSFVNFYPYSPEAPSHLKWELILQDSSGRVFQESAELKLVK